MKRPFIKCLLDGGGKDWDELPPYVAMGYRMSKQKLLGSERARTAVLRVIPLAFRNLAIAQKRDIERYRLVRGGGWDRPKVRFQSGDYVLLRQKNKDCLQPPARPHFLRVVELRSSGVVVLEGSDAARMLCQVKDIAHSSLPILDPSLHPNRFYRGPNLHRKVCGCRNHSRRMVLCDKCNEGYHIWCMEPPLMRVPEDSWTCPRHSGTFWTHH